MSYVSIIGSGNVGANTAFFIAEKGTTDVRLLDVKEGMSTGKALDMMEAAPIRKYRARIRGIDEFSEIAGSEAVVIAAGAVRQPGMKREDLFQANREMIEEMAPRIAETAADATVIVATEPVDPITTVFVEKSGLPRTRVLGVGGILDATRFQYLIAHELAVSPDNVAAMVIGRHSDAMMPLAQYSSVSGVPLPELVSEAKIEELVVETRRAGSVILDMAQRSTAYYAPSAAVAELVDAIHMDLGRVFPVSVLTDGEYGVKGAALSLPCVVDSGGIRRVLTPRLSAEIQSRLVASGQEVLDIVNGRTA